MYVLLIFVPIGLIYCGFLVYIQAKLIFCILCDLLVFGYLSVCLSYHVIDNLFDNLLIALFDLYLPLANILLLWHVISNYLL